VLDVDEVLRILDHLDVRIVDALLDIFDAERPSGRGSQDLNLAGASQTQGLQIGRACIRRRQQEGQRPSRLPAPPDIVPALNKVSGEIPGRLADELHGYVVPWHPRHLAP